MQEEKRIKKFEQQLKQPKIDMEKLRKIAWNGIPQKKRAETWKVLLGYQPVTATRVKKEIQMKRQEYREFVTQYYEQQGLERTLNEQAVLVQIQKDVPRTHPAPMFKQKQICQSMERILYISSLKQPACGYVQGHDTILTTFFTVFIAKEMNVQHVEHLLTADPSFFEESLKKDVLMNVEADAFYCLNTFLADIQDFYTSDVPGIVRSLKRLEMLIGKVNPALAKHMSRLQEEGEGLHYMQFAYRWINCLLLRELPLEVGVRLMDSYLAEGSTFESLHINVCTAILDHFAERLLQMDYFDVITFFQRMPTMQWTISEMDTILSQAFVYQHLYK